MAIPSYASAGAVAAGVTGSLATAFPGSVTANQIAVMAVCAFESDVALPGAFTSQSVISDGAGAYYRMGWKRCAGTEGGTTVNVTQSSNYIWAQIYTFNDCILTGTPYEGYDTATQVGGTAIVCPALTSTVADTLGVRIAQASFQAVTFTPAAGWTERVDNSGATGGIDSSLTVNTISKASIGTTASSNITAAFDPENGISVFSFALKPVPSTGIPNRKLIVPQAINRSLYW